MRLIKLLNLFPRSGFLVEMAWHFMAREMLECWGVGRQGTRMQGWGKQGCRNAGMVEYGDMGCRISGGVGLEEYSVYPRCREMEIRGDGGVLGVRTLGCRDTAAGQCNSIWSPTPTAQPQALQGNE